MKYNKTGKYKASARKFFLTKEELQQYIEDGMTREQIALKLNVSSALISNYKTKFKITTPYKKAKIFFTQEQIQSFIDKGYSRADCARTLKCNISTIQSFCEQYQIFFPRVERDKDTSMRRYALTSYVIGARSRNLEFSLSEEYFYELIVKPCVYCGSTKASVKQETNYIRSAKLPFYYTGIDRKDSSVGYTVENSVPCCFICNRAKRELPEETFREWIKNLVNFQNRSNDN